MKNLKSYILDCRQFFVYAGVFSFIINLLTLVAPLYMIQVFDRVISSKSNETLFMLTLLVVFLLVVQYYLEHLRSALFLRTSLTLQKKLQKSVLDSMLGMTGEGSRNRRGLDDLHTVQSFFSGAGLQAIFEIPWVPVYFLVLYLFHPFLLVLAVIGTVVLTGLAILEDRLSSETQATGQQRVLQSQDILNSALDNREIINALSMRKAVAERWNVVHDEALTKNTLASTQTVSVISWSKFVRQLMTTLALAVAAYLVITDRSVTPGIMIAASLVISRVMVPIDRIISSWKSFAKTREAYHRLDTMLADYDPKDSSVTLNEIEGNLTVERVFYSLNSERSVLRGIHFALPAGESLGIIGNSAAGKSTLTRLLVGVHKPTAGAVRIDGADVYQWSQTGELGPHIGYLPQSVELFAGTVAENIARMTDPVTNADAVMEAARLAGAHDFILRLPDGYDTYIGEAGSHLSAGQRQLVGLARALFGNPKFVVLDEPNANLDGPSEFAFARMLRELKQRRVTTVIVSHKPSVLRDVDKMLVLEQGRMTQYGPREEVMKTVLPIPESLVPSPVSLVRGA